MATMRTLILKKLPFLSLASRSAAASSSAPLFRLRPLISLAESRRSSVGIGGGSLQCFSTRPTNSSLNDPSPNWSNRPPKETILLDGCDFEHWLIVVDPPEATLTRDEIIQSYIKKLAEVVGSEDEARMKIYSVSTKHYFAFGALVSEELSYKIKPLAGVRWVLPDSYLNVREKDYGGEPFINGEAVPYDPKYHEEWVRNNARANERSRRNDRPRNQDRSRNFERRRENMQTYQNREAHPMNNQGPPNPMPPPPMSYQTREAEAPPMNNQGPSNSMPPPMPNNRPMPNRDYNAQSGYTPNRDVAPGYNGGGQGYQGSNPGGGPAYQGGQQRFNQPGYQGGGPAYQGGGPPYEGSRQGGSPAYQGGVQGGGPAYQGGGQGGGPAYQGGGPAYQGGGQGGGTAYQGGGPAYQGSGQGGGPTYQGGGPAYQGGGPSYQPSGPNYQGAPQYQEREVSGRDSQ